MRDDIIAYLTANVLTGFTVTSELPWTSTNQPLYEKNLKTIYTDRPQVVQEPLLDTLDGVGVIDEVTTINVYVTTDAKTLPTNYDALVTMIKAARLDSTQVGQTQRVTTTSTAYVDDALVTTFAISLRRLIKN